MIAQAIFLNGEEAVRGFDPHKNGASSEDDLFYWLMLSLTRRLYARDFEHEARPGHHDVYEVHSCHLSLQWD